MICWLLFFIAPVHADVDSVAKNTLLPRSFTSNLLRTCFIDTLLHYHKYNANNFPDITKIEEDLSTSTQSEVDISPEEQNPYKPKLLKRVYKNVKNAARRWYVNFHKSMMAAKKKRLSNLLQGIFNVTFEYAENFHPDPLGSLPFWSGSNVMTVGNNDGSADVDAYQFTLGNVRKDQSGQTKLGAIALRPYIRQVGADIQMHLTHRLEESGFYVGLKAPFGAMTVEPNLREIVPVELEYNIDFIQQTQNPGSTTIEYQWDRYPAPQNRPATILDAFYGGSGNSGKLDGNTYHLVRLRKGRVAYQKQDIIRISDILFSLGYNHWFDGAPARLAVGFKVSCPTGNVPSADYMLEPIFGRSGLWGLGGEFISSYTWQKKHTSQYIDIVVRGEFFHLMPGRTYNFRSFDLKHNGPGSKYLLVQHYRADYAKDAITNIVSEVFEPGTLQPAVNLTTLPVISKISLEGTSSVLINYYHDKWTIGLGVEAWGRTKETLAIDIRSAVDLRLPNLNDFAVVGRQVSSYAINGQPLLLDTYYCEPEARINKSQDAVRLIGSPPGVVPPSIVPNGIKDARDSKNRIPESLDEALDIQGAASLSVATGKLFTHCSYVFSEHKHKPSCGFFAALEFNGGIANNSVQYWSVGLYGSCSF